MSEKPQDNKKPDLHENFWETTDLESISSDEINIQEMESFMWSDTEGDDQLIYEQNEESKNVIAIEADNEEIDDFFKADTSELSITSEEEEEGETTKPAQVKDIEIHVKLLNDGVLNSLKTDEFKSNDHIPENNKNFAEYYNFKEVRINDEDTSNPLKFIRKEEDKIEQSFFENKHKNENSKLLVEDITSKIYEKQDSYPENDECKNQEVSLYGQSMCSNFNAVEALLNSDVIDEYNTEFRNKEFENDNTENKTHLDPEKLVTDYNLNIYCNNFDNTELQESIIDNQKSNITKEDSINEQFLCEDKKYHSKYSINNHKSSIICDLEQNNELVYTDFPANNQVDGLQREKVVLLDNETLMKTQSDDSLVKSPEREGNNIVFKDNQVTDFTIENEKYFESTDLNSVNCLEENSENTKLNSVQRADNITIMDNGNNKTTEYLHEDKVSHSVNECDKSIQELITNNLIIHDQDISETEHKVNYCSTNIVTDKNLSNIFNDQTEGDFFNEIFSHHYDSHNNINNFNQISNSSILEENNLLGDSNYERALVELDCSKAGFELENVETPISCVKIEEELKKVLSKEENANTIEKNNIFEDEQINNFNDNIVKTQTCKTNSVKKLQKNVMPKQSSINETEINHKDNEHTNDIYSLINETKHIKNETKKDAELIFNLLTDFKTENIYSPRKSCVNSLDHEIKKEISLHNPKHSEDLTIDNKVLNEFKAKFTENTQKINEKSAQNILSNKTENKNKDLNTEELNTEELNTEELNTEELNTEELNTEELNTEELNTEDLNAEELNAEDLNAEDLNAEDLNAEIIDLPDSLDIEYVVAEKLENIITENIATVNNNISEQNKEDKLSLANIWEDDSDTTNNFAIPLCKLPQNKNEEFVNQGITKDPDIIYRKSIENEFTESISLNNLEGVDITNKNTNFDSILHNTTLNINEEDQVCNQSKTEEINIPSHIGHINILNNKNETSSNNYPFISAYKQSSSSCTIKNNTTVEPFDQNTEIHIIPRPNINVNNERTLMFNNRFSRKRLIMLALHNKIIIAVPITQKNVDMNSKELVCSHKSKIIYLNSAEKTIFQMRNQLNERETKIRNIIHIDDRDLIDINKKEIDMVVSENDFTSTNNTFNNNKLFHILSESPNMAANEAIKSGNWLLGMLFSSESSEKMTDIITDILKRLFKNEKLVFASILLKKYNLAMENLYDIENYGLHYFYLGVKDFNKDFIEKLITKIFEISQLDALYCYIFVKRIYNQELCTNLFRHNIFCIETIFILDKSISVKDIYKLKQSYIDYVYKIDREDSFRFYEKNKSKLEKDFVIKYDALFNDKKWKFGGLKNIVDRGLGKIIGFDLDKRGTKKNNSPDNNKMKENIELLREINNQTINSVKIKNSCTSKIQDNCYEKKRIFDKAVNHENKKEENLIEIKTEINISDNDNSSSLQETPTISESQNIEPESDSPIIEDSDRKMDFYQQKKYAQSVSDISQLDKVNEKQITQDDTNNLVKSYLNLDDDDIVDKKKERKEEKPSFFSRFFGSKKQVFKAKQDSSASFEYDPLTKKWINKNVNNKETDIQAPQSSIAKEKALPKKVSASIQNPVIEKKSIYGRYSGGAKCETKSSVNIIIPGLKKENKKDE